MRSSSGSSCMVPPRRLLFSGGGIRVVSYLGVIQALHARNLLRHVREFCGVSAGALTALMLALNYKLHTIERFCYEYDFSSIRSVEPEDAMDFLEAFGIDSGESLQSLVEKILHHKGFAKTATFADLAARPGIHGLRVWATDLQNLCPVEFSAKATPDIQVAFAVRASMAFPMYFKPLFHPVTQTMLVDGGVMDNYPMSHLTEAEQEETLGCTFSFDARPVQIPDFVTFVGLLTNGYYMPSYQQLVARHEGRTIVIPCMETPVLHFEATVEERQVLVAKGRQAAEDFFNGLQEAKPSRRHSVS